MPATSKEILYETSKQGLIPGTGNDDDDFTEEEEEAKTNEEFVGTVAVPHYMGRSRRFLDTQYGNRNDGGQLMIGDSPRLIDTDYNFTINGTVCRGTEGLWEIVPLKNVNTQLIGMEDLKTFEKY